MTRSRLATCLLFLLTLSLPSAPLLADTQPGLTPDEARRAIALLQDDQRRDELLTTLKAIAEAPGEAQPTESKTEQAAEPAPVAIVPLEADGLIARTMRQMGEWADGLGEQVGQLAEAAHEVPGWTRAQFDDPVRRQSLLKALLGTVLVFTLGLALEWCLKRALNRPREALIAQANEASAQAHRAERQRQRQATAASAAVAAAPATEAPETATDDDSLRGQENVALVQTNRDGVEQVEAIPIGPAAQAPVAPPVAPQADLTQVEPQDHRGALRHLPYALAILVLDLLPLALFFATATLVMNRFTGGDDALETVLSSLVNAYVTTRVTMAVVRLLVSPQWHSLRLLRISPTLGDTLQAWIGRFVVLAIFGIALADAVQALGGSAQSRLLVLKVFSLLVHLCAAMLIIRTRRPVAELIAAPAGATGALATLRNWLAQTWALVAVIFVMGVWLVWAMGVENGFPKLLNFLALSGGILLLGRLAAILAIGALDRLFGPGGGTEAQSDPGARRYYPIARRLTGVVITLGTLIALCQSWGFNAVAWFAPGTIGSSLASAATTILIAAVGAIVVWQSVNAAIERRLVGWVQQGDLVRAARLRTLLPMLRTGLFIVMALIVILTALTQIGINTTPLLAGASIIGVALGFGSQKLVQDFITGMFLLMENAMQVGDWVTVAGVSGTVEYLSIRTVRLRAGDGSLHIVPFSSVSTVNNTNRGIGNAAVRISVGYDADIEQVIGELKAIGSGLREDPAFQELILSDIEVWGVDSVDGSMVTLAGQMRCIDKGRWGVQREINRRILERFRELGIEIANPRASLLVPSEGSLPPYARSAPSE